MDDILELEQLAVNISDKLDNANFELMGSIELSSLRRELEDLHRKNLLVKDKLRFDKSIDTADYDEYSRECEKMWEFVQRRLPPVIEAQRNKIHAAQERLKRKREIELLQKFNAENIKRLESELEEVTNHFYNAGSKELKEVYEVPMKALQKAIEKCKKLYVKYDKELAIIMHDMNALMKGGELTPIKPKRKYTRRKKTEVEEVKEEVNEEVKESQEVVEEAKVEAEKQEQLRLQEEERLKAEEAAKLEMERQEKLKAEEAARLEREKQEKLKAEEAARLEKEKQEKLKAEEEARLEKERQEKLKAEANPQEETREEHAQKFADSLPPLLPGYGSEPQNAQKVEDFSGNKKPAQDESDEEYSRKSTDIYDRVTPIIPRVKNRNSRLTKKVLKSVALAVGVGGVVYIAAGPLGLGALALGAYAGKKYFEHKYAHLMETHLGTIGGSVKVEDIEEPSETIIDRIKDIRDFLKTDEGKQKFRDIINERVENQTIFEDFTSSLRKFRPVEEVKEEIEDFPNVEETVEYTPSEGGMAL